MPNPSFQTRSQVKQDATHSAHTPTNLHTVESINHIPTIQRLHNGQGVGPLSAGQILQLQQTVGNQAVMRLINQSKASSTQAIQRIITSEDFKKQTSLSYGRKGKSAKEFEKFESLLKMYEKTKKDNLGFEAKLYALQNLKEWMDQWLASPGSKKSSRQQYVVNLNSEVETEIKQLHIVKENTEKSQAAPAAGANQPPQFGPANNQPSQAYAKAVSTYSSDMKKLVSTLESSSDPDEVKKAADLKTKITNSENNPKQPQDYAALEMPEYGRFEKEYLNFCEKYDLPRNPTMATTIWEELFKEFFNGAAMMAAAPIVTDQTRPDKNRTVMGTSGPNDTVVRNKIVAEAMTGLNLFIKHAEVHLAQAAFKTLKSSPNPTWVFWSGDGSKDVAKKNNPTGIVLEGSIGAWFDASKLNTLFSDMPFEWGQLMHIWAGLSEMYARQAAKHVLSFRYKGYVGKGAIMEQNIYNMIEKPTFSNVLQDQYKKAMSDQKVEKPEIKWYAVASLNRNPVFSEVAGGEPGTYYADTDRKKVEDEIKTRYP